MSRWVAYGVYQHVSEAPLQRYLTEFDFRYSNRVKLGIDDVQRTDLGHPRRPRTAADLPNSWWKAGSGTGRLSHHWIGRGAARTLLTTGQSELPLLLTDVEKE